MKRVGSQGHGTKNISIMHPHERTIWVALRKLKMYHHSENKSDRNIKLNIK
jgi:hypothetical protein